MQDLILQLFDKNSNPSSLSTTQSELDSDSEYQQAESPREYPGDHQRKLTTILTNFSEEDIKILGKGFFCKNEFHHQIQEMETKEFMFVC